MKSRLAGLLALLALIGCGGGGGGTSGTPAPTTASLKLTVAWPSRGRIIPAASDSLRTVVRPALNQPISGQVTITRPATSGTISGIPVDTPQFVISEALDANGKVVGSRSVQMSFSAGSSPSLTIDLDSTVASVSLTSPSPTLPVGGSLTLSASAVNSNGDAVLLTASKLAWSITSGQASASVNSLGVLSGVLAGPVTVSVKDSESGKEGTVTVTVIAVSGMEDLGPASGYFSGSNAISSDGSTIVGFAGPWARAFRWTQAGGMQILGTLGGDQSSAYDCSSDGSVVVGSASVSGNDFRAFRWTASGGMVNLGNLGGSGNNIGNAKACSADGSVVVGYSASPDGDRAFRWTSLTGMQLLGQGARDATGISADGSVVVGWTTNGAGQGEAFRWTQAGGLQLLGTLGGRWSVAHAVSADGSVIVGESENSGFFTRAFRWTASSGMQDLGTLGGGNPTAVARAVSADGSVVVGESENTNFFRRAFRWTAAAGMQDLGTLGGDTSAAYGISGNGKIIVGRAATYLGPERAFRLAVP